MLVLACVIIAAVSGCKKKRKKKAPVAETVDAAGSAVAEPVPIPDATPLPALTGAEPASDGRIHFYVAGADGLEAEASMPAEHRTWYGQVKAKIAACDRKQPISIKNVDITVQYRNGAAASVGIPSSVPDDLLTCIDAAFRLAPPPASMTSTRVKWHLAIGEGGGAPTPTPTGTGRKEVTILGWRQDGKLVEGSPVKGWIEEVLTRPYAQCLMVKPLGTSWTVDLEIAPSGDLTSVRVKGNSARSPATADADPATKCIIEASQGAKMDKPPKEGAKVQITFNVGSA